MNIIPLSALQHYLFCPRQCALIHNEALWQENYLTAVGRQLHERVDSGITENRKNMRYERGVLVASEKLGLKGKLDLLEVDLAAKTYTPIEYKKGKPKKDDSDSVQLCAQVLCVEEMLNTRIDTAYFWYYAVRRRVALEMNSALRDKTVSVIRAVRELFDLGITPKSPVDKHCKSCSLFDDCSPFLFKDTSSEYIKKLFCCDL